MGKPIRAANQAKKAGCVISLLSFYYNRHTFANLYDVATFMMAKLMVALEAFEVTFFVVTFAALMGEVKTAFMPKMVMALGTMVVMALPIKQSHTINPLIH